MENKGEDRRMVGKGGRKVREIKEIIERRWEGNRRTSRKEEEGKGDKVYGRGKDVCI